MLLFQLLHIVSFMAPPLSKSHVVLACDLVMVSNSNMRKYRHTQSRSGNDEKARRVSIP